MKSRIDYIREDKPDGSGYVMEGRMMGTVGGCLDILAYCVISLMNVPKKIPPIMVPPWSYPKQRAMNPAMKIKTLSKLMRRMLFLVCSTS